MLDDIVFTGELERVILEFPQGPLNAPIDIIFENNTISELTLVSTTQSERIIFIIG